MDQEKFGKLIKEIRKKNNAIIVEGYFDTIALHQSGITNSISCMGTALTEYQMDIIKKLTSNITLFFDFDTAGKNAVLSSLPLLLEKGFSVSVVMYSSQEDAADICKKLAFCNSDVKMFIKKNLRDAIGWYIELATKNYERLVERERVVAMNKINPLLDKIQNEPNRRIYYSTACKKLDLTNC